ncbi:MAG: hypothetical protein R3318_06725, partial [Gammaproteobacteria bacterium]|nr:hypothetical protein [Gammaproteobacteria bacterium]
MVNTRYFSLIILCASLLVLSACATRPQPSATPEVTVEDRTQEPQTREKQIEPPSDATRETVKEPADARPPDTDSRATQTQEVIRYESGPAVSALLDSVDGHATAGNNSRAVADLERALRIEPKNPHLWQRLGYLYLAEENWVQAIAAAKKSSVLAARNRYIQAENWRIIATAREGLGDLQGAATARENSE